MYRYIERERKREINREREINRDRGRGTRRYKEKKYSRRPCSPYEGVP